MDLPGATYLTALAALAVSFVGFTSIAIAFLNVTRGKLSVQHSTLVHIFVIYGLSAAAFALLPILMRLLGLPDDVIWHLSSALYAIAALALLWSALRVRLRLALRFPTRVLINFAIGIVICVLAGLNATGLLFDPYVGPYALGVTLLLAMSALIFVENLDEFLQVRAEGSD